MKSIFSFIVKYSGIVALATVVACLIAFGCPLSKSKVGVIDMRRALTADVYQLIIANEQKHTNAMKARQESDVKLLQAELSALQEKIKAAGKKESDYPKEFQQIKQKVDFYNQKYNMQAQLIARASLVAKDQITPKVLEVLGEFEKCGYKVIVSKESVLFSSESVDLTDKFIEKLNAQNITVAYPDPAQLLIAQNAMMQQTEQRAVQPVVEESAQTEKPAVTQPTTEKTKPAQSAAKKTTKEKKK